MKFYLFIALLPFTVFSQPLVATKEQCEAIFLKENLQLMAGKLKIEQADALVKQAKLWPNPTFTLDEINFWATKDQTGGAEVVPPLWGSVGRNQQFGASFEQLILTAGKRKKLVALEQLNVQKEMIFFEELLLQLKVEFRNLLSDLFYAQAMEKAYQQELSAVDRLVKIYEQQQQLSNLSKGEVVRLKALKFELTNAMNEVKNDRIATQKELSTLMRLPAGTELILEDESASTVTFPTISLQQLIEQAKENHVEVRLAEAEKQYAEKRLAYEKAMAVPDLSLKVAYDRNGSVMKDFVGFGFTMDLPLYNRNQGNRKYAELARNEAEIMKQTAHLKIEHEVTAAYQNMLLAKDFLKELDANYESDLDQLIEKYQENFEKRNIGMLEFIDFLEAYLATKKIMLEAVKKAQQAKEILNYTVGTEIK